jgi:hypothetical protein
MFTALKKRLKGAERVLGGKSKVTAIVAFASEGFSSFFLLNICQPAQSLSKP